MPDGEKSVVRKSALETADWLDSRKMEDMADPIRDLARSNEMLEDQMTAAMIEQTKLRARLDEIQPIEDERTPFAATVAALERHCYTPAELAQWLEAEQPLDGKRPIDLLREGNAEELRDRIIGWIEGAAGGIFV